MHGPFPGKLDLVHLGALFQKRLAHWEITLLSRLYQGGTLVLPDRINIGSATYKLERAFGKSVEDAYMEGPVALLITFVYLGILL